MPSQLSRGFGRRARELRATGAQLAPVRVPIQSPWRGYQPDLVANERDHNALIACVGIIPRGGWLTTDAGWEQLDSANLPLGRDDESVGFTDSVAGTYGTGDTAVTSGNAQPVIGLGNFNRVNRVSGLFATEVMAITADSGGTPGTHTETGHLFRKTKTGNWVSIEFDSSDGDLTLGPAVVTSAVPMNGTNELLPDIAVFQPGVPGATMNAGADQIVEVPEAVMIWCNGADQDQIMYYPDASSSSGSSNQNYTDFRSYATQLTGASAGATVYGVDPGFTAMSAQSCESWDNRMFYLNVVQDAVHYSTRLVWSVVGNPFIVDRSYEADDGTNNFNGIGAGYIELEQFTTEGLRVEELGDVLACYTMDGVALIRRKSILPSDPYIETYLTKDRGLVSTHALANLGGGAHFGIFNDGWWIVTINGFKEVGRIGDESSLSRAFSREPEQRILYKWKHDFYRRLNQEKIDLVTTEYDPINRIVRISCPMDGSDTANEVWIFEVESDRVFLDDYTNIGGNDESALCWEGIIRTNQDASSWTDLGTASNPPGLWSSYAGNSWASYGQSFSDRATAHGDARGYVYVHDDEEELRDGNPPNWSFQTSPHHLGALSTIKTIEALWVEYENRQSQIMQAVAVITTAERGQSAVIPLNEGAETSIQVSKSHYRVPGHHYQLSMGGVGRPKIGAMSLQVLIDRPEPGVEDIGTEG